MGEVPEQSLEGALALGTKAPVSVSGIVATVGEDMVSPTRVSVFLVQ